MRVTDLRTLFCCHGYGFGARFFCSMSATIHGTMGEFLADDGFKSCPHVLWQRGRVGVSWPDEVD